MIYKAYKDLFRCRQFMGFLFNVGATTFDIALPLLIGKYAGLVRANQAGELSDDGLADEKKALEKIGLPLVVFSSICQWISSVIYLQTFYKIARVLRYELYHNYLQKCS